MIRPLRSTIALRLHHLLDRFEPPVMGDLCRFHIGCHILVNGETCELIAVAHTADVTALFTDRGEFEVGIRWPLTFVEPIATVTPIGLVS